MEACNISQIENIFFQAMTEIAKLNPEYGANLEFENIYDAQPKQGFQI